MEQVRNRITRKTVLVLLGVTKAFASTQKSIPGKWHNIIDSLRISSQTAHLKLIEIDDEAAAEFYDMEEEFKRKIGKGKLYSKEDLNQAERKIDQAFTQKK